MAHDSGLSSVWVDRLVELHVLAENGDHAAARQAARWVDGDPAARRIWESVERDCQQLRKDGQSSPHLHR
jgi:hypothetical protein